MPNPTSPPEQGAASSEEKRFSITLDQETFDHAQFIADLWNALDAARKRKRYRKWAVSNVSPFLIKASAAGVLDEMGGYPKTKEDRKAVIARAVADVEREMKKQQ